MSPVSPKERVELAEQAGINEQYLYQCLSGRRDMDAAEAARVERDTGQRIRRWHLRKDWHEVWPELVGADGAPEPATSEPARVGG
jgi:DNA-binding transcriptional regulator YdaS (Cro superfamily)